MRAAADEQQLKIGGRKSGDVFNAVRPKFHLINPAKPLVRGSLRQECVSGYWERAGGPRPSSASAWVWSGVGSVIWMTVVGVPCPLSRQRFRQRVPNAFKSVWKLCTSPPPPCAVPPDRAAVWRVSFFSLAEAETAAGSLVRITSIPSNAASRSIASVFGPHVSVGEGTFDDEEFVDRGDGAIGQEPSEGLDAVGGPVGQVQEGPLDDLLALAFSFSQEDGRS